jgi:DNA-binding PadR family transcriptional regulator
MKALKPIELMTLAALSEGPVHGYALAQRVADLTAARMGLRPGNLYRVLSRLELRGLVETIGAREAEGGEDGEERRRQYALTPGGRKRAAAELDMYAQVLERAQGLTRILGDA